MEQWQQLSLSLYCKFVIDLTQCVKAGSGFPTCSRVITVSEIWGEKRCFLPSNQAVSVRKLPSIRLSAMPICSAARVCHGDYQSESWQPYRILHAQEQAVDRPHLTAGLFTCVYTNMHVHTDCPLSPLLPSLCTSVGQNVLLLCFLDADGREISKMPLHFHPDKARPSIYSMYWTLLPPSGGYSRTNEGAVISYSKHVLVAGGEGTHRTWSNAYLHF